MRTLIIVTILMMSVSLAAMADPIVDPGFGAPSRIHATTYLEIDYEPPTPLGPGSGGMSGDMSPGTDTISYVIVADAAPETGESQSLEFSKYGTNGTFGLYYDSGVAPTQPGYVIESVFKITDILSDEFKVLHSWRMCADILIRPSATGGMVDISIGGVGYNMDITKNEWHTFQGMRINPTGNDEYMRYWVDGAFWCNSGASIDDGLYNDRVDISFNHKAAQGEVICDRMSIYDPIPEPSLLLIGLGGLALLRLRRKK